MLRTITALLICTAALAGCNRFSGWMSPSSAKGPVTLDPKGGYPVSKQDARQLVPGMVSAAWEGIGEGRLLVVVANPPQKGWWKVALVNRTPQPEGRFTPDEDGVLRLDLVGYSPMQTSMGGAIAPATSADRITVALPLTHTVLASVARIEINAAGRTISLRP